MNAPREKIILRSPDMALTRLFSTELAVPMAIAKILTLRGLRTVDECSKFFKPEIGHFHDPFLFKDMEKAADRIIAAIAASQRISIYGDYDVDGITATVIVLKALRALGARCDYYLPNRLTEGYGLSAEGVAKLHEAGTRLIITVDCGISAREEAVLANKLGIDLIITDHHEPQETMPEAWAVLDPKSPGSGYPDDGLAGVGVALKLCHALAKKTGKPETFWTAYLDLAAVGTAADIVPLIGENRTIAQLGFEQLRRTSNSGLKALIAEQGLSGKPLSTGEVGFQIAPCINAVGRLGDPKRGVELLLTEDPITAARYARELKEANIERRAIDKAMQEEAFAWAERHFDPTRDHAIVIARPNWHCGVVGIVASKVAERYHRPALLFSINDDGIARGSGRSIAAVHLHKALTECKSLLENFGGHAAAAGMTMKACNLEKFTIRFNEVVGREVAFEDMVPHINADAQIELTECTYPFFNALKRIEPFGPGNARPLFLCRNLTHKYEPRIVGTNHLKMTVAAQGSMLDAVGFNFGHRLNEVKNARTFSLAFSLDENEWNGRKSLQMKVKGVEL